MNNAKKPALMSIVALLLLVACSESENHRRFQPAPAPVPLLERYVLGSMDSVPEGVAFDSGDRVFYASSLQGGGITRIAADGTESEFRTPDNRAQLLGMAVDSSNRRLWVCAREVDGMDNRVWVYDLDSAQMTMEFLLAALASGGSCNDVALDERGLAYVSDSNNPNIYRLDPATELGEVFITDPLLADVFGIGLAGNGLVVSPDQNSLYVGKFVEAQLLRVALPDASAIGLIALAGDTLPPPDGLVIVADDLYTIANNSVSRIRLNAELTMGTVVTREQISGLSTGVLAEERLYAIKSEVVSFVAQQPFDLPFEIFSVDLSAFDSP